MASAIPIMPPPGTASVNTVDQTSNPSASANPWASKPNSASAKPAPQNSSTKRMHFIMLKMGFRLILGVCVTRADSLIAILMQTYASRYASLSLNLCSRVIDQQQQGTRLPQHRHSWILQV